MKSLVKSRLHKELDALERAYDMEAGFLTMTEFADYRTEQANKAFIHRVKELKALITVIELLPDEHLKTIEDILKDYK